MRKMLDLSLYYTASEAAKVIGKNSGREIDADYMRNLKRYGSIATVKVGNSNLYLKKDVDSYSVEAPGVKANRARRASSLKKKGSAGKEKQETAA